MGCTEGLARILVFIANFAFLLVGAALLILGIVYKVNFTKFTDAIPSDYQAISYIPTLAIVVGVIIFVIAFLGCCGTLRSNSCMLTSYASILIIIFLAQVALGVFAIVKIKDENDLQTKVNATLTTLFNQFGTSDSVTGVINLIQEKFECCGTTGSSYWTGSLPASCYTSGVQHTTGCSSVVFEFFQSSVKVIAIVALAVSVTEIVGAVLALCLSSCIRGRS